MAGVEPHSTTQDLIEQNLHTTFDQYCCGNNIDCQSQITVLPKYVLNLNKLIMLLLQYFSLRILLLCLQRYNSQQEKITTPVEISPELVLAEFSDDG